MVDMMGEKSTNKQNEDAVKKTRTAYQRLIQVLGVYNAALRENNEKAIVYGKETSKA